MRPPLPLLLLLLGFAAAYEAIVYSLDEQDTKEVWARIEYEPVKKTADFARVSSAPARRLVVETDDGRLSGSYIPTTSKAQDEISLFLNQDDKVWHIEYFKTSSDDSPIVRFANRPVQAPQPILNRPIVVDLKGKQTATEPEKSFIQQYWYYLIPFAVILLTSGGSK